jgi:hypothetical protein
MEMSAREREGIEKKGANEGKESCQACGNDKQAEKFSRCKGCESVWYCDKVSFND